MPKIRELIFDTDPYAGLDITAYEPDIHGWHSDDPIFKSLIMEVQPHRLLEIGSWKGASALHMASILLQLGLTDAELCCVDTWLGSLEFWLMRDIPVFYRALAHKNGYPSIYYTFLRNVVSANFTEYITPFPITSSIAARFFNHFGLKFDLIYIDGSHDFEDVISDIKNYWPLLSATGVLFGDDYGADEVRRAVIETSQEFGVVPEIVGEKWVFRKS